MGAPSSTKAAMVSATSSATQLVLPLLLFCCFFCSPVAEAAVSCTKTYTIVAGDICWDISQTYGITVSYLQSLNPGINCDNLQVGQIICVSGTTSTSTTPSPPPPPKSVSCTKTYTIVAGDICWAISQSYGITVSYLQSLNPGINCDNLQVGQVICVSGTTSTSTTPPPPPPPSPPPPAGTGNNGKIFREYIGALWNGVKLTNIPINSNAEVHVILAFAVDYTSDGTTAANGQFRPAWDTGSITAAAIQSFKSTYSNVKFIVSLGGDTVFVQPSTNNPVQFKPTSVSSWVSNAVSSLTSLVQTYHLDGIDVDYEHFDYATTSDFASAICQLFTKLKQAGVIRIASIAPYSDTNTQYVAVWNQCASQINYINYQFYTYSASTTVSQYLTYYNAAVSKYSGSGPKVLTSFTTTPNSGAVTPSVVLQASQQLHAAKSLPGIFNWCADASYTNSAGFTYETQAQTIVTSS